jgi:uncharacterized protein
MNEVFSGQNGQRIGKFLSLSLVFLAIFLFVQVVVGLKKLNYIGREIYPQRTIMVSGEGEAFAIPDIASFSYSIVEEGKTVAEAQKKSDDKMASALAALKEGGIEDKDIKTTNYSFYPKYEWEQAYCIQSVNVRCPSGKNVLQGYEVNQTITVKVRKTEQAGELVTKIGTLGATNVSGVEFTVDDRDKYVALARASAINKAKENGKKLEDELGIKLGKMLYFNENGNYPMPYYAEGKGGVGMDMAASNQSSRATLPGGESKITSNVSLTYEIK